MTASSSSRLFLSAAVLLALTVPAFATPAYTVTPLPGMSPVAGGITSTSLNKWGQVIGMSATTHGPVIWTPKPDNGSVGKILDLSKQPGFPTNVNAFNKGGPSALNDVGQVVGNVPVTSGGDPNGQLSWMWRPTTLNTVKGVLHATKGTVTVFAEFNTGSFATSEYPASINNYGQITGHGSYYNPVLFTPSTANSGTGSWATDNTIGSSDFFINDAGQVGGGVYGANLPNWKGWDFAFVQQGFPPVSHSALISSSQWSNNSHHDALAINQHGDVIVSAIPTTVNAVHGYLVRNGVVSDVGAGDGTFLYALNDSDMMTGARTEGPTAVAFLNSGGVNYDLNTLVPAQVNGHNFNVNPQPGPIAINGMGQILTTGSDGTNMLFILTPAAAVAGKQPGLTSAAAKAAGAGTFTRKVTVKNTTGAVLNGPVQVMFGDLPPGVSVVGAAGVTSFVGPAGSPYVTFSSSDLPAAGTAVVTVSFMAPSAASVTYNARVLVGAAPR